MNQSHETHISIRVGANQEERVFIVRLQLTMGVSKNHMSMLEQICRYVWTGEDKNMGKPRNEENM